MRAWRIKILQPKSGERQISFIFHAFFFLFGAFVIEFLAFLYFMLLWETADALFACSEAFGDFAAFPGRFFRLSGGV